MFGKRLELGSAAQQLYVCRVVGELAEKDFDFCTASDFERIMEKLEADPNKGEWSMKKFVDHTKKFMRWLRLKYWYPEDYPGRRELEPMRILLQQNFKKRRGGMNPPEVDSLQAEAPKSAINDDDKPSFEEIGLAWDHIHSASAHPRDRALTGMIKSKGNRIGGIGTLRGRDVVETEMGFKAVIRDKNRNKVLAEPLFVNCAGDILSWIKERRNLLMSMGVPEGEWDDLPFWLQLRGDKPEALNYIGWRKLLMRLREKHNKRYPEKKITKRLYAHLARYYREGMDQLGDVPDNVRRKERGWSPQSIMPGRYGALIESKNIEEWYRKRLGLKKRKEKGEEDRAPVVCWRCNKVNVPRTNWCFNCGAPSPRRRLEPSRQRRRRCPRWSAWWRRSESSSTRTSSLSSRRSR